MSCYNCIYYERDDDRRICYKGIKGHLFNGTACKHYDDGYIAPARTEQKGGNDNE